MMTTTDLDLTLYFRKNRTPPSSVLLLKVPSDKLVKEQSRRISPTVELRSRLQKTRQATTNINGFHINNSDINESPSLISYDWHRHTDRITQIPSAPDVAYRNTYLDELKQEKSTIVNSDHRSQLSNSRSPSPRSHYSQQQQQQQQQILSRVKTANSASHNTSNPFQRKQYQQYRTVYDYIRESIKQIERQRNLKQQNFSTRIKRPQNDDVVLRRVLAEKKSSNISRNSSTTRRPHGNPESFVNYINHSREQIRILHTTTPNHYYQHQSTNQKYNRLRTNTSQDQTDSPDKQRTILMSTSTVANS